MTVKLYFVYTAAIVCAVPAVAQERFNSAEAAAQAVIDAAGSHDSARLFAILGPRAAGILTSGSAAQDRNEQAEFARLARAKHRLEVSPSTRIAPSSPSATRTGPFRCPFDA